MQLNVNTMAVFFDDNNQIARFDEMTHFIFYTKEHDQWQKSIPIAFRPVLTGGMTTIRENITKMLDAFDQCQIIITKSISGLPYQIFDKAGLIICESEAFDLELLDAIEADLLLQKADAEADAKILTVAPIEINQSGHFFIDLTQLQKKHPEMSTKMALLPFLKDTPFYALEIVCDHIPPWFEQKLSGMKLVYSLSHEGPDGKHVIITHAVCTE